MPLIIFDIDGTLVDSQAHILEAQARAFAAHDLPVPPARVGLSVVGLSLAEAFTVLAGPEAPIDGLAQSYKDAWGDLRQQPGYDERLYPGAGDLVADLASRAGVTLGIATGKTRRGLDRLLAAQGWDGLFATIQTADHHPSKPHPSMIEACLAETGITAEHAVMVGDTAYDVTMAVSAGIAAIGVAWGYHEPDALRATGAMMVAEDMAALRALLFSFDTRDRA